MQEWCPSHLIAEKDCPAPGIVRMNHRQVINFYAGINCSLIPVHQSGSTVSVAFVGVPTGLGVHAVAQRRESEPIGVQHKQIGRPRLYTTRLALSDPCDTLR